MKYSTTQHQDSHSGVILQHAGKKRSLSFISTSSDKAYEAPKRRRRVRFSKSPTEYKLDQQEKLPSQHNIWYSKRELAVFTKQAQNHVLGFGNPSKDETTRGYERYDFERMQQKIMTRKVVLLLMQQKVLNDEEKSLIAQKSSSWAVEEAFVRGCMDFCDAYHPKLSHILQQNNTNGGLEASLLQETERRKLSQHYREIGSRAA